MKKIIFSLLAFSMLSFQSCSNEPGTKAIEKVESTTKHKSHISLKTAEGKMHWTAFKFTERVGVKGTFNTIEIKESVEGHTLSEALKGIGFKIPVNGVNSNNEDRDKKLQDYFFGVMKETATISGNFGEFKGDDKSGNCTIIINMNGLSKSVNFEYQLNENTLALKSLIDLNNWEGEFALNSINQKCEDLHKGKDGKSILWPEVKIEIEIPVSN